MPLSDKTDAQLSDLLTDYGIKHGPVVNSTRSLYEKKLEEALAKDRTFYREEEEEITYIICRHPRRKKTSANPSAQFLPGSEQNGDQPPDQAEEMDQESSTELDQQTQQNLHLVSVKTNHRTTSHSKMKVKGPISRQSAGKTRMVIPAVLVLTGLAAGCYLVLPTVM
ncbi:lamina-associated polypeptide 2, isoforms beta/delta/epsilon/gamma-like [Poecilia latipinna]|uniref:lamina-associated polypeptide 2, isoforms beta/delta/epsilon/gamma-like n=1 Tax=Poecilia latipinna TaxID=48699 RepID=UPI00072DD4C0|nr:PREDICTED: lamina-associated polypeptide 2, isoforms beta/delta/epsilon/gamma-like [Poecilia latipinna]